MDAEPVVNGPAPTLSLGAAIVVVVLPVVLVVAVIAGLVSVGRDAERCTYVDLGHGLIKQCRNDDGSYTLEDTDGNTATMDVSSAP